MGNERQLRFLVVDDNEDIRDVFCRLVERAGHVAATAYDGQDAVETLERDKFDVMLLDQAAEDVANVLVVIDHEETQLPLVAHTSRLVKRLASRWVSAESCPLGGP